MNKKLIRLTEGDLHRIVKESLNRILKETYDPCDELGHIRWRNRDYRNNSDDAQRVGKVRGEALANYNKRTKESENKVQEEGYDDEYNPHPDNNWHGYGNPTRERWDADEIPYKYKQRTYESKIKRAVEESVDEVMYNGRSYHGSNSNDWRDLGDERENRMFRRDPRMGTKVSDMDSEQLLNHAKNGLDFSKIKSLNDRIDSKGNVHNDMNNMTPEEWQQWTKDASASIRNYGNYHATRNDYTPNEKEKYSQKAYEKARDWNNYRNRGFNAALQQWNENTIKRAVEESVQKILKEDNGSYRGIVLLDTGDSEEELRQKIDACYNKGMSTERIQNAVNWWANWWNNQNDEYRKLCQP